MTIMDRLRKQDCKNKKLNRYHTNQRQLPATNYPVASCEAIKPKINSQQVIANQPQGSVLNERSGIKALEYTDTGNGIRTFHNELRLNSIDSKGYASRLLQKVPRFQAEDLDVTSSVFVDIETNGIGSSTSTINFLVGVGKVLNGSMFTKIFLLKDLSASTEYYKTIKTEIEGKTVFTYNGKSFDIPRLNAGFILNRIDYEINDDIDLLHITRKQLKGQLSSCKLSVVEKEILSLARPCGDIAGRDIPALYKEYLMTGDISLLDRVVLHNLWDIASLVSLAGYLHSEFKTNQNQADLYNGN